MTPSPSTMTLSTNTYSLFDLPPEKTVGTMLYVQYVSDIFFISDEPKQVLQFTHNQVRRSKVFKKGDMLLIVDRIERDGGFPPLLKILHDENFYYFSLAPFGMAVNEYQYTRSYRILLDSSLDAALCTKERKEREIG